jgi:hypothetical protein
MKFKTHVNISGLGNSGKSVISDYLSEFEGVFVPRKDFEFNLLRAPGGLMDLKYALKDNWSPIRSDDAIRRFKKLVLRLGTHVQISKPKKLLNAAGFNYEHFFPGFDELTRKFIDEVTTFKYAGVWPYLFYHSPSYQLIYDRVKGKINGKGVLSNIYFSDIPDIDKKVETLFYDILDLGLKGKSYHTVLTHNSFEIFGMRSNLDLLTNTKSIIVIRDPRDIYVNVVEGNKGNIPFFNKINPNYYNITAANEIDKYIKYQKKILSYLNNVKDNRMLIIKFEDFVLNYSEVSLKINEFLNLDSQAHVRRMEYFNPEISKLNIGLFMEFKNQQNIRKIEDDLSDYWKFKDIHS